MQLIFYYMGFMALGDIADYLIGLLVERIWPQASLLIFFAALLRLPLGRLAAGGEADGAETRQASRTLRRACHIA